MNRGSRRIISSGNETVREFLPRFFDLARRSAYEIRDSIIEYEFLFTFTEGYGEGRESKWK